VACSSVKFTSTMTEHTSATASYLYHYTHLQLPLIFTLNILLCLYTLQGSYHSLTQPFITLHQRTPKLHVSTLSGHLQAIKVYKIKITNARTFLHDYTEISIFKCYQYI
jgi:hypothetical protein